ncbi:MAG: response regulator transcription factor [Rhizobiaceae bacterium]
MRLLLVEDNTRLATLIRDGLAGHGFAVDWFATMDGAHEALRAVDYQLVLLDLGLPDGDGLDLIRALRRERIATPILVITARGVLGDRVAGLDSGADDYLVKPFDLSELAARCRALLRRPGSTLGAVLGAGNVSLDVGAREVRVDERRVEMTPREVSVLEHLLRRAGQVVPKSALENSLYAMHAEVTPNALEAAVSRLRKRLAAAGADVRLHTAHGIGYALFAPADEHDDDRA